MSDCQKKPAEERRYRVNYNNGAAKRDMKVGEKKIGKKNDGTIDFRAINKITVVGTETIPNAKKCFNLPGVKLYPTSIFLRAIGNCNKDMIVVEYFQIGTLFKIRI